MSIRQASSVAEIQHKFQVPEARCAQAGITQRSCLVQSEESFVPGVGRQEHNAPGSSR